MEAKQLPLIDKSIKSFCKLSFNGFKEDIYNFNEFGKSTSIQKFPNDEIDLPVYVNEYWTSKQRAASSLHEVSYRACFKPQLPRFFINRLTNEGDIVYDPFMGRGTTLLEASLLGRRPSGCDINPLSKILIEPRLSPPDLYQVEHRLTKLDLYSNSPEIYEDLLAFYHPITLRQIMNLREYLLTRKSNNSIDYIDSWIRMVATNRLTGHSSGFFSAYTLPPNQSVSIETQLKINADRNQPPPERDIASLILRKSRTLLKKVTPSQIRNIREVSEEAKILNTSCDYTPEIENSIINLVVTSPPFLDVVNYQKDNWLRCWFNGIESSKISIWQFRKEKEWMASMTQVFKELLRILVPGGYVAFEVGDIRGGRLLMETLVVPAATTAGLEPLLVLVNDQKFTKTANCWGVSNSKKGTNTNRIILLRKPIDI